MVGMRHGDAIPESKPDEDVRLGGAHGESQPRGSGSQPGGARVLGHLDGKGNDQRLRASRCVSERSRRSRPQSPATREVHMDGQCESNDEFNEIMS